MSQNLVFLAGRKALETIRDEGLKPEMVKVMAGAAGGPKWLVLSHLDRVVFSSWLQRRKQPLFLVGSSIGAWRFAAAAQRNPLEAIERLEYAYIHQRYSLKPSRREVDLQGIKILDALLGSSGVGEILGHPFLRLSIMAARCRWPVATENRLLLGFGLIDAALYNAVHSSGLKFFFERSLFYDSRDVPPFFGMNGSSAHRIPLDHKNLGFALLASGAIPLVMSGIRNIPGAPSGVYRDGGVVDYHFNIPFMPDGTEGVVLFPHYMDRIIPGWFDKKLPWRRPLEANTDRVLLVAPSREFVNRLPYGKIPDRQDFVTFKGRDDERIACWNTVARESAQLGEDFIDAVQTGSIKRLVQPMPGHG